MTADPNSEFPKQFDFQQGESRAWKLWEESGVFSTAVDQSKPPFCVVMPPPNVTGILHMGHILDNVPQDIMVRWHRMRGFAAVWIPGTDHAGIATQNVVKRQLDKEGINYKDLGREAFIERVWQWKEQSGDIIAEQLRRLGCSCAWDRQRFTMDEALSHAVVEAFIRWYEKDLIYRGLRMINWCPTCGTALADDEVEHEEQQGHLWHLRYPLVDAEGYLTVATTRPETMLGDVAVAIHPEDPRYSALHGKQVLLPLQDKKIPIIADDFVDPSFGSGAVKITPAHDPNDYEVSQRHNLQAIDVLGPDAKMTAEAGPFAGLERYQARSQVVAALEEAGLLDKIEDHRNNVGKCYRCATVVEPRLSKQWFVKMKPLAQSALQAVEAGRIEIVPSSEKNDFFFWLNNIKDWCISRQLWWGHRIPVYYCQQCQADVAAREMPESCAQCGASSFVQDEDVLDTWFSSQLWPFSTLGWPEQTAEMNYWYPNSWLMSGRDILFFWDARMIMSGLELVGDVPFRTLVLHGLVRDAQGRKLSKSLGNSPDPLKLFEDYGTDAIRAAIIQRYPLGRQDTRLSDDLYRSGAGVITKLWNSCRFVFLNIEQGSSAGLDLTEIAPEKLKIEDRWIITELRRAIAEHDRYLAASDFTHSFEAITTFFWDRFCDWYLEIAKLRLYGENKEEKAAALSVCCTVLRSVLKLFHPYIPFVTEELWQSLRQMLGQGATQSLVDEQQQVLALSPWPELDSFPADQDAEAAVSEMISVVRAVREARGELNLPPRKELVAEVQYFNRASEARFPEYQQIMSAMGHLAEIKLSDGKVKPKNWIPVSFDGGLVHLAIPQEVEIAELRKSLQQKIIKLQAAQKGVEAKLSNQGYLANAAAEVVDETRRRSEELSKSIEKVNLFLKAVE